MRASCHGVLSCRRHPTRSCVKTSLHLHAWPTPTGMLIHACIHASSHVLLPTPTHQTNQPTNPCQELRKGKDKLAKAQSANRDVLHTVAELHLPVESSANSQGVCLLPAATVEALLVDKRRMELVQPFKLALLKLSSQVCAAKEARGEARRGRGRGDGGCGVLHLLDGTGRRRPGWCCRHAGERGWVRWVGKSGNRKRERPGGQGGGPMLPPA